MNGHLNGPSISLVFQYFHKQEPLLQSIVSKFVKHTTKSWVSNHTTSTSAVKDQSFIIAGDSPIYEGTRFMDRMKLIQKNSSL